MLLGVQVQLWEPVSLWLPGYLESFLPLLLQTLPAGFLFHPFLACKDYCDVSLWSVLGNLYHCAKHPGQSICLEKGAILVPALEVC